MVRVFVCSSLSHQLISFVGKRTSVRYGSFQRPVQGNSSWIKRLYLTKKLEEHRGCVNTIQWNADGNLLVTGSDDCKLVRFPLSVGAKLLVLNIHERTSGLLALDISSSVRLAQVIVATSFAPNLYLSRAILVWSLAGWMEKSDALSLTPETQTDSWFEISLPIDNL